MKQVHTFTSFAGRPGQALLACVLFLTGSSAAFAADLVVLPAGSSDALADAIAAAGPHGVVLVESGLHTESGMVTIDIPVSIVGEEGAVLEVATVPDDTPPFDVSPGLYVFDTHGVVIEGLTLVPAPGPADIGIVIQDSSRVTVRNNAISGFFSGIFVHRGDHAKISGNLLEDMRHGAILINGRHVRFIGNTVRRMARYGVWLNDVGGECQFNDISETFVGILLCHLVGDFIWPEGSAGAAMLPGTAWHVANNKVRDSVFGIWVVDGASLNLINNNDIASSGEVDILLDSEFIDEDGTVYPGAIRNLVVLGRYKDVEVEDLGIGNRVLGAKD